MIDIIRYAKRAVELTSEYCNENDNCEHCEDRRMYLEDLKYLQRTYHTSVKPLITHEDRAAQHTSEENKEG